MTPTAIATDHGRRHDICIDGRRIAYLEAGQGDRACLLIHGLAASWDYWAHTIPALARTHRVIAVDLPGFGRSENPDTHGIDAQLPALPAFMDAVGLDSCAVLGHSMGTLVACELAARYPERVNRLVLSGGPIVSVIDLFNHPFRTLTARPKTASFLMEALTAGVRPSRFVRHVILHTAWGRWIAFRAYVPKPALLAAEDLSRVMFGVGAAGVIPTLRHGFGYDLRPALASVRQPTIIVNGALDTICPPADAHAFAESNDAVQTLHLLPGIGHWPMIEVPDEFNRIVGAFLAER